MMDKLKGLVLDNEGDEVDVERLVAMVDGGTADALRAFVGTNGVTKVRIVVASDSTTAIAAGLGLDAGLDRALHEIARSAERSMESLREFSKMVERDFLRDLPKHEQARASVRIAAGLEPRPLPVGRSVATRFRRLARSACPPRFGFYQGEHG